MTQSTLKIPSIAVPSLIGKEGYKIKDLEATSGAAISISRTQDGDAWVWVSISGSTEAIHIATLLIKMSVLHTRAADKVLAPDNNKDKMAEARLAAISFHREMFEAAFYTRFPRIKPML